LSRASYPRVAGGPDDAVALRVDARGGCVMPRELKAKATRTYRAEVLDDQRRNKTKRVAARTKRNRAAQQDEFDRRGEDPVVQFVRRTRIPKKRRE
jgi:hypothetical protein